MTTKPDKQADDLINDLNVVLEKNLIEEYLHEKGYSRKGLKELPAELVETLMKEATRYAALKMEEVKARAHFVTEIHASTSSLE
jgi:hypothetical protein